MTYESNASTYEISIPAAEIHTYSSMHGFLRAMERTGLHQHQALRLIRNAWSRGKSPDQLSTTRQKQFLKRYASIMCDGPANLRVYSRWLFIFNAEGILITMHGLPRSFFKKHAYDADKHPIRNFRAYSRMYAAPAFDLDFECA